MKIVLIIIAILCIVGYFLLGKGDNKGEDAETHTRQSSVDINNLIVTPGVGIGPVRFGMTKDEVIKLLGKPDVARGSNLIYLSKGFEFMVMEPGGVRTISCCAKQCYGGSMQAKNADDFRGATDKGIRIGSTESQVIAAYGNPTRRGKGLRGGPSLRYKNLGTSFEFQNGKLVQFMLSKPR